LTERLSLQARFVHNHYARRSRYRYCQVGFMDSKKPNSFSARALRYLEQMDEIEGWFTLEAAWCTVCLNDAQQRNGTRGSVVEIGVHHGKSFILLCLLRSQEETAVCYDLFERQDENIDRSGKGNLAILIRNLQYAGISQSHLKLITANSLDLTGAIVRRDAESPIRMFSIDGGHTAEITRNDLSIATEAIADDGVIILDDFFNESWPGVATGAAQFIRDYPKKMVPFAVVGNKVFFAKTDRAAESYRQILSKSNILAEHFAIKISEFFGHPVLVGVDARKAIRVSPKLWLLIRRVSFLKSPRVLAGKIARRISRRFRSRSLNFD